MEHLLSTFCGFSRLQISRSKSRVWFSLNTPGYLHNSICSEFYISATADLGMYLCVSLIHKRPTRLFNYLLDKANRKLVG